MNNAPWQVLAWQSVTVPANGLDSLARTLQHLNTIIDARSEDAIGLRRGQILWGSAPSNQSRVGIAFEWGEVSDQVPTLADPMSIVSNLLFADDRGRPLDQSQQILCLNTVIHEIPWQDSIPSRGGVFKRMLWRDTLPRAA